MDQHIVPFKAEHQNVALDKLLAAIGGWAALGIRVRWPYRSIEIDVVPHLRAIALEKLPELMLF